MLRTPVLGLALVLSTPALWSAFVTGSMSLQTAMIRFLIAIPIAAAMLCVLQAMMQAYQRQSRRVARSQLLARTQDETAINTPQEASSTNHFGYGETGPS